MTNDDPESDLREGIEAAERGDVAGREDIIDDINGPEILRLRVNQIDHMTTADVNLIQRLAREDVPVREIPERTLEWLVELGVITVDGESASLKPDGVVFAPIVTPGRGQREVRYGGYNKEVELENAELPPDREPRSDE